MDDRFIEVYRHILTTVSIPQCWRVIRSEFIETPLGCGNLPSRFSDPNEEFKVFYSALNFETAIRETIIRDELDYSFSRTIDFMDVEPFSSVELESIDKLSLIDLTDGNAFNVSIPHSVRHGTDYSTSQNLSLFVHENIPEADGFCYRSRLDDKLCYAVFEKSVSAKLAVVNCVNLSKNPLTLLTLEKLRVKVVH